MSAGDVDSPDYRPLARARLYAGDVEHGAGMETIANFRRWMKNITAEYAPWREIGLYGLDKLDEGMRTGEFDMAPFEAPTMADVEETPGYQFRLMEGEKALRRQAGSSGMSMSGPAAKALMRYGQNYATEQYDTEYDRALKKYALQQHERAQRFGRLFKLAGVGQEAQGDIARYGFDTEQLTGKYRQIAKQALGMGKIGYETEMLNHEIAELKAKQASGGFLSGVLGTVGTGVGYLAGGPVGGMIGGGVGRGVGRMI